MFWGCFTYDSKGPCHIWREESAADRIEADKKIKALNDGFEVMKRQEWEATNAIIRLGLRNRPGRRAQWRFTEKTGKLVRRGKGGIDWYRYNKVSSLSYSITYDSKPLQFIVIPKMIPFAQQCKRKRPETIVQEDNAPSHAHWYTKYTYSIHNLAYLLWPPNSPDLNAIEKCWWYLKLRTTFYGAPTSKKEAEKAWRKAWRELPQTEIQKWIQGIMRNIQEVLRLEGGNEYKEGRDLRRGFHGRRKIGELFKHAYINDERNNDNGNGDSEYEDWREVFTDQNTMTIGDGDGEVSLTSSSDTTELSDSSE